MNLTDILPCTAKELFDIQHSLLEERSDMKARKERLQPFADAFMMCMEKCGPLTNNPKEEYCIHMSALALLDLMIEEYYKTHVI